MKTLDEVIKACEETVSDVDRGVDIEGCYLGATETRDALHYLKEYKKYNDTMCALPDYYEWVHSADNPPLTWGELKGMEGKPVWVEYNFHIGNKDFRDKSKRWCIVREFKPWHDTEIIITENGFVLSKREQIKDWQAYRKERS